MILGKVIHNCLRQDFINKMLFLRFINLAEGIQRVLWMTMPFAYFGRNQSKASRRLILKMDENSARLR